jgi:hypothetical protein
MLDDLWRKTMSLARNWGQTPMIPPLSVPATDLEHVSSKHARTLKNRAIEPITWIAKAIPIDRKLL